MTHKYSIDTKERTQVTVYLTVIGVFLTFLLQKALGLVKIECWWLPAPSAITIFWSLHFLFNNYLWKCSIFRKVHLVRTRDISGTWEGNITTSHDNHEQAIDAKLRIIQNWTIIEFALETEKSDSKSISAHLSFDHPHDVRIYYQYENEPITGSPEAMNIHYGTVFLELSSDGTKLTGNYYTGRGRGTQGTMAFERIH